MSYVGCTTKGCYWMVCPDAALSSLQLVKLRKKSAFVGAEHLFFVRIGVLLLGRIACSFSQIYKPHLCIGFVLVHESLLCSQGCQKQFCTAPFMIQLLLVHLATTQTRYSNSKDLKGST